MADQATDPVDAGQTAGTAVATNEPTANIATDTIAGAAPEETAAEPAVAAIESTAAKSTAEQAVINTTEASNADAEKKATDKAPEQEQEAKEKALEQAENDVDEVDKEEGKNFQLKGRGGDHRASGYPGIQGQGHKNARKNDYKNYNDNVKTRFEDQPESDDPIEIRRQVEFYFSNSNLVLDKHLLNKVTLENKPVALKEIHDFKRMKHFQPYSAVLEAVKQSRVLAVNDQEEVYRIEPLPNKFTMDVYKNADLLDSDTQKRSLYMKGFPEEDSDTQFKIEELLKPYGVQVVRLRRTHEKIFKGSIFAEFVDEDSATQFLALEDKPTYNEKTLLCMTKKEYVEGKNGEIRDGTVRPKSPRRNEYTNRNGNGRHNDFKRGNKRSRDNNRGDRDGRTKFRRKNDA